jgi:hypothetical protein
VFQIWIAQESILTLYVADVLYPAEPRHPRADVRAFSQPETMYHNDIVRPYEAADFNRSLNPGSKSVRKPPVSSAQPMNGGAVPNISTSPERVLE